MAGSFLDMRLHARHAGTSDTGVEVIPAEAVEAAAKALAKADLRGGFSKDDYTDALTALEAAAPHIRALAWDDGYTKGKSDATDTQGFHVNPDRKYL